MGRDTEKEPPLAEVILIWSEPDKLMPKLTNICVETVPVSPPLEFIYDLEE